MARKDGMGIDTQCGLSSCESARRAAQALVLTALLAAGLCFGCQPTVPEPPADTPAPTATPTPLPTDTPMPEWVNQNVDFLGQDALRTAVQYALKTTDTEIAGGRLAQVEELILVDGASITDLSPLAHAESLRSLVILDGEMELTPLAALPSLTRLTLTGGHFGDLSKVTVLDKLEELNLFHYEIADFTPLAALTNLRTLRLGNHRNYEYLGLDRLTNLTTLLLADQSRNDLSWLGKLTNLESLTLWPCKQRDFEWITKLDKLTELHLDMRTDSDLTPIGKLAGLKRLAINFESGRMLDPMWLGELVGLEELYLRGAHFGKLESLAGMTKLDALTVDDIRITFDVELLPAFPELTALTVRNCGVKNAKMLTKLPKLTRFALYGGSIDEPQAVAALTNLTALALRPRMEGGYRSLGGVERVAGLVRLTELDWGGRAGSLERLSALTKLQKLNLSGARVTDLKYLARLSTLRELDVSNNGFSKLPDLSALTELTDINLAGTRIKNFEALSALPALTHATLAGNRVVEPMQLAQVPNLYAVTLTNRVRNAREEARLRAAQQTMDEALRTHLAFANTADSQAVKNRFLLTSFLHVPCYGSPAWYAPLEQTY